MTAITVFCRTYSICDCICRLIAPDTCTGEGHQPERGVRLQFLQPAANEEKLDKETILGDY